MPPIGGNTLGLQVTERLPDDVERVRAANPSALTLDGTNTYVVHSWVIDPGPDDPAHLQRVLDAARHAVHGIVITHGHEDHDEGAARLAAAAGGVPILYPGRGDSSGPFEVLPTPGHSRDSVCLVFANVCFTGDTVLGEGSVFISPDGGGLGPYLEALETLLERGFDALCPGHGPIVWNPREKLEGYIAHRPARERRVIAAIDGGAETRDQILEIVWSDAPLDSDPLLRQVALETLEAHLDKLKDEGRLPGALAAG